MSNEKLGNILKEDWKSEETLIILLGNVNGIPVVKNHWKN